MAARTPVAAGARLGRVAAAAIWAGSNSDLPAAAPAVWLAPQAGENAEALSHEDYLNAPGEKATSTFKTAGKYSYYCEPHQGAGMKGTVIVQ